MISGDAGCAINFISFFDSSAALVFSSGNASARQQPFSITCPGSTISEFSFACNGAAGSAFGTTASLLQLGSVKCSNGVKPLYAGLSNVCGGVVGNAFESLADGTCSRCVGSTQCPPPGAPPCDLARCVIQPSPLDAPWPMAGRDNARRSQSPNPGPAPGLALAWASAAPGAGAAFQGITVGPSEAIFATRLGGFPQPLGLLRLQGAAGGAVAWSSAVPTSSHTFTVGPWGTLLGSVTNAVGLRAAAVVSADTGELLGAMGGSYTQDVGALQEVTLAEDYSAWALGGHESPAAAPPQIAYLGCASIFSFFLGLGALAPLPHPALLSLPPFSPPLALPPARRSYSCAGTPPYTQAMAAPVYTSAPAGGASVGLLLPAIFNGTIFHAGSTPSELAAHSMSSAGADGVAPLLWSYAGMNGALASLSVSWDGASVFVGSASGAVTSLAAGSGAVQWSTPSPCPQACTFGTAALSALSRDGQRLFVPVGAAGGGGPPAFSGVLALGTRSGNVSWSLPTAAPVQALALDAQGTLYVGDLGGAVYAVKGSSGAVAALFNTPGGAGVLPNGLALGASGMLYVATPNAVLALGANPSAGVVE